MLIILTDGSRSANSNISEVGLSTKPARSLENSQNILVIKGLVEDRIPTQSCQRLGRWAIVLIQFSGISLLAKLEKGFHLFLHKFSTALIAQVDLIFVDDHDPHALPLFPAGLADLGFDLGFKLPHEEGVCNRFSDLSTRDTLDVCHGMRILPKDYEVSVRWEL